MKLRRRGSEERVELVHGLVAGRLASCELTVDDASVSRKHARFVEEGGRWFVEDLGSSNGTLRNGAKVQREELRGGDLLTLGSVAFDVLAPSAAVPAGSVERGAVPSAGASAAAGESAAGVFEVPVEEAPPAAPAAGSRAAVEAERAALRHELRSDRRSRGLGDIGQQPLPIRLLVYAGCLLLLYGVVQGIRLLAGA